MSETDEELQKTHRRFAVQCFNHVWSLLDKTDRTPEEVDEMIHEAHASRFHWGRIGAPINFARGEWQISRVYAVLGRAEAARHHAERCLEICRANGIGDFDIAYAHEALARAAAASGNHSAFDEHYGEARRLGEQIAGKDDRALFTSDLVAGPWFGLVP